MNSLDKKTGFAFKTLPFFPFSTAKVQNPFYFCTKFIN